MAVAICNPELDLDGSPIFPVDGVYGAVRLWAEGDPPAPTNIWILIGQFNQNSPGLQRIKSEHTVLLQQKQDEIFAHAKVALSDYGINKRRTFQMDIKVPQAVIDGYSG